MIWNVSSWGLLFLGYQSNKVGEGSALYHLRDDYEVGTNTNNGALATAALNKVGISDETLIIAQATASAEEAIKSGTGGQPALADRAEYQAYMHSLGQTQFEDSILLSVLLSDSPAKLLNDEGGFLTESMPSFLLYGFSTIEKNDKLLLSLHVVFENRANALSGVDLLDEQFDDYPNLMLVDSFVVEETAVIILMPQQEDPLTWSQLLKNKK